MTYIYTPTGDSASYSDNSASVIFIGEKICYEMVYNTLPLGWVAKNRHLKKNLTLKGLIRHSKYSHVVKQTTDCYFGDFDHWKRFLVLVSPKK